MTLLDSRRFHVLLLGLALIVSGCSGTKDQKPDDKKKDDDHDHAPGPHKGVVFDFGTKLHAEFTVDHPTKTVKVYILGGNPKTLPSTPINADKLTLTIKGFKDPIVLKPDPQKGDPGGQASCFSAKDDRFEKEQEFAGELIGDIDGKQVTGKFEEKPDHEHEKK